MPKLEMVAGYPIGKHRSGRYYLRVNVPGLGERVYSTGESEFKKALKVAREIERELLKIDPGYRPEFYEDIAEKAFEVCQKGNRESTVKEARYIYNQLIEAFRGLRMDEVTDDLWLEQIRIWEKTTTRRSFKQVRVYAVQIDNFAFRKGFKRTRCDFPVSDPKEREGKVLSEKEFARLLDGCAFKYRDGKKVEPAEPFTGIAATRGKRRRLLLKLWRYHGTRKMESALLTLDRVNLETRSIVFRADDVKTGSKTKKGREIGIAPEVFQDIEEAVRDAVAAGSQYLIPNDRGTGPIDERSVGRQMRLLAQATGVQFNPNDIRHTFIHNKVLVERKNTSAVAIYVGNSVKVIHDKYLHAKVDHTRHVVDAVVEEPKDKPPPAKSRLEVIQGGMKK